MDTFRYVAILPGRAILFSCLPKKPKSGLIYTNPLINDTEATAQFQDIVDFAVSEFNATVVHTVETSYLAFYEAYIVPTVVVR